MVWGEAVSGGWERRAGRAEPESCGRALVDSGAALAPGFKDEEECRRANLKRGEPWPAATDRWRAARR